MRSMSVDLNREECIENVRKALKIQNLEELPHYDTVNNFLSGLDPTELEKIRDYMIRELLKKRCFESYRIEGEFWGVIVDGTGLHTFKEKHCDHCLKQTHNKGKEDEYTIYMHHVLEAKLVIGDMVFSIATEFIENESEDVTKQDCELNAFHRLAKKLKQAFKRLPICIMGDSLYACEAVFKICEENKWKYIFRFKEGRIKTIAAEFMAIKKLENITTKDDKFWVNGISYNERTTNVMEAQIEMKNETVRTYVFITDIEIKSKNIERLIDVGRSRWKIENEGFNQQKNLRFDIGHVNSHDYTAMKNHYLIVQIADILMQLYENGLTIIKKHKKTAKEKSSNLLEAIRSRVLTVEDLVALVKPIQVRFT